MNQAIRPLPIWQRMLKRVAVRGQRLAHDVVQLNFTKGTARLLV